MSSKKIIGIPGWKMENSFGASLTYLKFISRFGKPRIIMPEDDLSKVDAILMPGGPDILPSLFGENPGFATSNPCVHRTNFMVQKLPIAIKKGMPIFGICLGMQMLNVSFSGKLTQDLPYHAQSKNRYEAGHSIEFFQGEFYRDTKGKDKKYEVNSHHHQGVTRDDLSTSFIPIAMAENEEDDENFIVEAMIHNELPIAGVQWHPEEWLDAVAIELFNNVLNR